MSDWGESLVYFGARFAPTLKPRYRDSRVFTWLGAFAIALWATWPILSLKTQSIPSLECMTIIFLIAWLTLRCLPCRFTESDTSIATNASWIPAAAFAAGESGSTVFFLLAIKHIAAAEANILIFLWPAMTVGFGAMLGLFRLRVRDVCGIALGFAGVAVLMNVSFSASIEGIAFALLGGLSWALYCIFRLQWTRPSGPVLARGFMLSAIVCALLHFVLESTIMPSISVFLTAALIGVVPTAIANVLWDKGFCQGDSQLLAVMAYGTPLCAGALLCAFGYQALSARLLLGALAIVGAGVLSRRESASPSS